MSLILEKILSYLSVFVVMAILSVDVNETNREESPVNGMNSFLRESAKNMISYLSNYEISDPALKNRAKTFLEKLEKNKNMRGAMAEIISSLLNEFNVPWLYPLLEELAKNKAKKILEISEDSLYGDDCIEDEYGMKCGGTAPNDALGVTNDAKVQDYMEPPFTNDSSDGYQYGNIIYSPMGKEKIDTNKIYRQNEVEDNYHELTDTGDIAYQDSNILDEDSSDTQDNRNLRENRFDESYPFNFMLFGSTMDQYSNKRESLNTEIDTVYRESNQEMMENDKIHYPNFRISHLEGSKNNEDKTHSRNLGNVNNAEPQKANIVEKSGDYSYEITNHVVKSHENQVSVRNGNENPVSNENKSDSMKEMYYFESYDEEIDENNAGFGRKLLGWKDGKDSTYEYRDKDYEYPNFFYTEVVDEGDYLNNLRKNHTNFEFKQIEGNYSDSLRKNLSRRRGLNQTKEIIGQVSVGNGNEDPVSNEIKSDSNEDMYFESSDEETDENHAVFKRKLLGVNYKSEYPDVFNSKVFDGEYDLNSLRNNNTNYTFIQMLREGTHSDSLRKHLSRRRELNQAKEIIGQVSVGNGIENPLSNENKSDSMKEMYFESYDEEIYENHTGFGKKVLEFNEEKMNETHTNFVLEQNLGEADYLEIPLRKNLSRRRELNRAKRNYDSAAMLKGCPVPPNLETVQGYCKSIPSRTTCHLYCIKGYTFPEGITRTLECSPDRGWDKDFEECKPYADCTLKLRSGGTLECALTTATKNAQCYVSCRRHGLYPAKGKRLYQCNALGLWTPVLPHCVVREGIDLVEPPPVVEHDSIDYP